jgi:hypothetical protein
MLAGFGVDFADTGKFRALTPEVFVLLMDNGIPMAAGELPRGARLTSTSAATS